MLRLSYIDIFLETLLYLGMYQWGSHPAHSICLCKGNTPYRTLRTVSGKSTVCSFLSGMLIIEEGERKSGIT